MLRARVPAPRFFIVGAIAIPLVIGALIVGRRLRTGSPAYALAAAGTAFRDHDGRRLMYYVDLDALTDQVADEGVEWLVVQRQRSRLLALRGEVGDEAPAPDSSDRIRQLKAALAERGARVVAAALAAGTADSANVAARMSDAATALPPLDVMLGGDHLDFVRIGAPQTLGDGRIVPVVFEYRELGETVAMRLVLARRAGRWVVTGLADFDQTLTEIGDAQTERLRALNRPIEDRLAAAVALGAPTVVDAAARRARGRPTSDLRLTVPIRNLSSTPLREVTILLQSRTADDGYAESLTVPMALPSGASASVSWSFGAARSSRAAWLLARPDELMLRVRAAVFDSAGRADSLRIAASYDETRHARPIRPPSTDSGAASS
jgi:hypothetical protein